MNSGETPELARHLTKGIWTLKSSTSFPDLNLGGRGAFQPSNLLRNLWLKDNGYSKQFKTFCEAKLGSPNSNFPERIAISITIEATSWPGDS